MSCDDCPNACATFEGLPPAGRQPYGVRVRSADGVQVVEMNIPDVGTIVPQHVHRYAHLTMVARGSVEVWRNGVGLGVVSAPGAIEVPAGVAHTLQSREPDTVCYCIHNVARSGEIEIERPARNIVRAL